MSRCIMMYINEQDYINLIGWFGFRFKSVFAIDLVASKNTAHFKSDQTWPRNTLTEVESYP